MKIDAVTKTEMKVAVGTILIMGFASLIGLISGRFVAFFLFGAMYWDLASDIIKAKHTSGEWRKK